MDTITLMVSAEYSDFKKFLDDFLIKHSNNALTTKEMKGNDFSTHLWYTAFGARIDFKITIVEEGLAVVVSTTATHDERLQYHIDEIIQSVQNKFHPSTLHSEFIKKTSNELHMNEQTIQHLIQLKNTHVKRLQILELQAAQLGLSVPPHILLEIEDIQIKIQNINVQIKNTNSPIKDTNMNPISILFLSADPTNASRLRLGEELREIQEKLQLAKLREKFTLVERMSVRPADVSQALLDVQPQIVHFSGHGTTSGELCLENQVGQIQPVSPDALAALFKQFSHEVNCVLLNACYAEIQAKAISQHITYVIGMNKAIGDKAAIAFSIGFYQTIGAGRSIEDAFELGKAQIMLQGIPEHLTPVLIKKSN